MIIYKYYLSLKELTKMKIFSKMISISVATLMLFGCSGNNNSSNSNTESKQKEQTTDTTSTQALTEESIASVLPVLSIETKSKDENVLDFITKPVAGHVSEDIASWTPKYKIPPEPYYEDCTITLKSKYGDIMLDSAEAKVKVRGNWTTLYDKKPLKIKFTEKQSLLGLNNGAEQKNWLLLAEYKDASMLRNKAALYASREILSSDGLFAADLDFVQVEINGEYFGLYLLSDNQQVSSHRVNITEPDKDYTGTDIGYFMEYDGYFENEDELHRFPLDLAGNAPLITFNGTDKGQSIKALPDSPNEQKKPVGVSIKSDIYSQEQHDFIDNFVNNTYRIMYEAAYNNKAFVFDSEYKNLSETTDITPQQAIENVVDVQSLVDMYIISELTCDADIYWSSFYMDADFGPDGKKKLVFEAPWDFDSSMGNKERCIDGTGFYASNVVPDVNGGSQFNGYDTINPWLVILAHQEWYQDMIKKTWTKAYDNGVFDRTCKLISNYSTDLKIDFEKNYKKWNNIKNNEDFVNELSKPARKCKTEKEAADFLLSWLESRIEFLNSQWHN